MLEVVHLSQKLESKTVSLVLGEWRNSRSANQNKYYFGVVLPMLCNPLGYKDSESNYVHEVVKEMFLSTKITNPITKSKRKTVRSTSDLNTTKFEHYISSIKTWASADLGIYIPDPNEYEIY